MSSSQPNICEITASQNAALEVKQNSLNMKGEKISRQHSDLKLRFNAFLESMTSENENKESEKPATKTLNSDIETLISSNEISSVLENAFNFLDPPNNIKSEIDILHPENTRTISPKDIQCAPQDIVKHNQNIEGIKDIKNHDGKLDKIDRSTTNQSSNTIKENKIVPKSIDPLILNSSKTNSNLTSIINELPPAKPHRNVSKREEKCHMKQENTNNTREEEKLLEIKPDLPKNHLDHIYFKIDTDLSEKLINSNKSPRDISIDKLIENHQYLQVPGIDFHRKYSIDTTGFRKSNYLTVPVKESILSSRVSLFVEEIKPKIPDGGWGWLVVFGALFINLVSDGLGSTFGILNVKFLEEFQASNSATSLIGSLFTSVPLLAGPIGSALVDKYGCRNMTILGGIMSTVGLILSCYARNIIVMYITFGFIGGVGFCLCYVTAVVSIAFWFEKNRTIALGIAATGTGFGTVIYSPLLTYLLNEYGWRGTVLILAGITANIILSGLLMKDPDWIIKEDRKYKQEKKKRKEEQRRLNVKKKQKENYVVQNVVAIDMSKSFGKCSSVVNMPTYLRRNEEVPKEVLKRLSENKELYNIILENYPHLISCKSASECDKINNSTDSEPKRVPVKYCMTLKKLEEEEEEIKNARNSHKKEKEVASKIPLLRSLSTKSNKENANNNHHYLKSIRFRKNSIGYRGVLLNIHRYKLAASSCPDFLKNSELTLNEDDDDEEWYDDYVDVIKDLTHFSLFMELHFFLFSIATIIMGVWFIVPYFYLPVHMNTFGYGDGEVAVIFSAIGVANIVGMIIFGYLGDKLNCTKIYAISIILSGVTIWGMMFFTNNYAMLIIFSGLFGLVYASCFALTPSILGSLVPLDHFTMAYGLYLLCQGIGSLAGPPIAGLLFDLTNSYAQSFYQSAFWVILSGVLVGIIPYVENTKVYKFKFIRNKN